MSTTLQQSKWKQRTNLQRMQISWKSSFHHGRGPPTWGANHPHTLAREGLRAWKGARGRSLQPQSASKKCHWPYWWEGARSRKCYQFHRVGPDRCHHARPDTEPRQKAAGHTSPACQSETSCFSNELWRSGHRRTSAGKFPLIMVQSTAHSRQLWTRHVAAIKEY